MALFFISYDLRNEKNYQKITNELKRLNAVRILESCWCFKQTNMTSKDLKDYFKQFLDNDDGIIVSQITGWASYNALETPNDLK